MRGGRAIGVAVLLVCLAVVSPHRAIAQTPTPTTSQSTDAGFFTDFRIGDALAAASSIGVALLAFWLFRIQGEKTALLEEKAKKARDDLDDQKKRCDEEIDRERRHTEQLRELNAAAEKLLRDQLDKAERRVGIGEGGQLSAENAELPEDLRANIAELLGVIREMRDARQEMEPVTAKSVGQIVAEHMVQGNGYFLAREYKQAVEEYTKALAREPDNVTLLDNRGLAFYRLGYDENAFADFDLSLRIKPDRPIALVSRGAAHDGLGRYEQAVTDYKRAIDLQPTYWLAFMNLAIAYDHIEQRADARSAYDRAVELAPSDVLARLNRAALLAKIGESEAAGGDLDYAIANGNLEAFRRDLARRARVHPYFDPLRNNPSLRAKLEQILGDEPPSS